MNKSQSMSYYLNKFTDLIKNKVYVDSNPLEGNKTLNRPILPEEKKDNITNINDFTRSEHTGIFITLK
jgi:hypothetical protein